MAYKNLEEAIQASGKVSIAAPSVTIDVSGPLAAGTLQIGGGALRATGGTTLVEGTTTRSSGGEGGG